MLSIADWISFYEKDYEFVGLLEGTYYDNHGRPTERLEKVILFKKSCFILICNFKFLRCKNN